MNNLINDVNDEAKDKEENTVILNDFSIFSDELEDALKETIIIEKEFKDGKRKGYNNVNEMMRSIE